MFVIIQGPISARKLFVSLGLAALCAIYAMTQSNCESDFQISLWTLILITYVTALAGLITFYPRAADGIFGKSKCPHCMKATWTLQDILRLSRWFHPKCTNCSSFVRLKIEWGILFFLVFPLWLAALVLSNSFAVSIVTVMLYVLFYLKVLTSAQVLK